MLHNFEDLRGRVGSTEPKTVAVACAHDGHTLEAVLRAAQEGILRYILIGHADEILSVGRTLGCEIDPSAVINDYEIASSSIAAGLCEYPEGCLEAMQQHFRCYVLNAAEIAESLGSAKCMNIVLFGSMAKALGMDDIDWESVIAETVPEKFRELNLRAFRAGHEAAGK